MGAEFRTDWQRLAASTLDWWRDAGVDVLVEDAPRNWLAPPAPAPAKAGAAAAVASASPLPGTIEAFVAWRMGPDAPEAGWPAIRIAPAGAAPARTMILTDMPEAVDAAAMRLLDGPAGRLLDNILAAIGESRESTHLAAVAWARTVTGQIGGEAAAELGRLARHHVALVAPERLLLLGQAAARAVLSDDSADGKAQAAIAYPNGSAQAVVIHHPRFLLERPAGKADAWKQLQSWTGS